jgi:hypothetical protein
MNGTFHRNDELFMFPNDRGLRCINSRMCWLLPVSFLTVNSRERFPSRGGKVNILERFRKYRKSLLYLSLNGGKLGWWQKWLVMYELKKRWSRR